MIARGVKMGGFNICHAAVGLDFGFANSVKLQSSKPRGERQTALASFRGPFGTRRGGLRVARTWGIAVLGLEGSWFNQMRFNSDTGIL